jgi:hypothetical protein
LPYAIGRIAKYGGADACIFAKPLRAETLPKCAKDCKMPPKRHPLFVEEQMRSIGHFIGGREVKGSS